VLAARLIRKRLAPTRAASVRGTGGGGTIGHPSSAIGNPDGDHWRRSRWRQRDRVGDHSPPNERMAQV